MGDGKYQVKSLHPRFLQCFAGKTRVGPVARSSGGWERHDVVPFDHNMEVFFCEEIDEAFETIRAFLIEFGKF